MAVYGYNVESHRGMFRFCHQHGIRLSVRYNYLEEIYEDPSRFDGLIVNVKSEDQQMIELISRIKKPVVVINKQCGLPFPVVKEDDSKVGELAAEYLLAKKLSHFVYYTRESWGSLQAAKLSAFEKYLNIHGQRVTPFYLRPAGKEKSKQELIATILESGGTVGCFCSDDAAAVELIPALQQAGIALPEQLCLLGSSNLVLANWTDQPISSIEVDREAIGYNAAETLYKLIKGEVSNNKQEILVPPLRVIERESSAFHPGFPAELNKALAFIGSNFQEKSINLELIASNSFISVRKLQTLTKKHLGRTPSELLMDARIKEAQRMLVAADYPLEYIAGQCGFNSSQYFITVFRKLTGKTPHQFRRFS